MLKNYLLLDYMQTLPEASAAYEMYRWKIPWEHNHLCIVMSHNYSFTHAKVQSQESIQSITTAKPATTLLSKKYLSSICEASSKFDKTAKSYNINMQLYIHSIVKAWSGHIC